MNTLSDIITYVRRLIKTPSNAVITDSLLIDYINRFYLMDMDARAQFFDLKTYYSFQTIPGIHKYNMPLYTPQVQNGDSNYTISYYPVYQGFMMPFKVNGIICPLYTQTNEFYNIWPNYVQQVSQVGTGNGSNGPYTLQAPFFPTITGHVDMTGVIAFANQFSRYQDPIFITSTEINNIPTDDFISAIPVTSVDSSVYFTATAANGKNIVVADTGLFMQDGTDGNLYGLLMEPGQAPNGNLPLSNGPAPYYTTTQNTINYSTGVATNVYFNEPIPDGVPIKAEAYYIEQGLSRAALYFNNVLTIFPPPNTQYRIDIEAYLTPAAFLNTSAAIPFAYMAEYIARGAARKILADTGDWDQFNAYEPLFREQETLVWKRSQRQFTSTRTQTIFSNSGFQNNFNQGSSGY